MGGLLSAVEGNRPVSRNGVRYIRAGNYFIGPMKCFFDGSETTTGGGHSWLTLAGYIAYDSFWGDFNRSWKSEVLEKREPHAPYLHMWQVVSGNGPHAGWSHWRPWVYLSGVQMVLRDVA